MNRRSWTTVVVSVVLASLVWGSLAPAASGAEPLAAAPQSVEVPTENAPGPPPAKVMRTDQWMYELENAAPTAMTVPLSTFIFPGSHDAGTYGIKPVLACSGCEDVLMPMHEDCEDKLPGALHFLCDTWSGTLADVSLPWARAQEKTVLQQLNAGSRFLDLRFFRANADDQERTKNEVLKLQAGEFYIHHTLAGPRIGEIMDSIVTFLNTPGHERELIVLRLDHLKEGSGTMGSDSMNVLFSYIESRLGTELAPPANAATTSPKDLLDAGHRVILAYDYSPPTDENGNPLPPMDPAHVAKLWTIQNAWTHINDDPATPDDREDGYPLPDDPDKPWRNRSEIVTTTSQTFSQRSDQNALFSAGVAIGADEGIFQIIRQAICPGDPLSALPGPDGRQLCPAISSDYDQFEGLNEVSSFTNSLLLPSLTQIPREFVNMVHVDFYPDAFTQEAYTLNRGAMRTALRILTVEELESHDGGLEVDISNYEPDFYPVIVYPDVPSTAWATVDERNQRRPDAETIHPWWPGWRAYPNDWGMAQFTFGIRDADMFSDDDNSKIHGSSIWESVAIDATGCFHDVFKCPQVAQPGAVQVSGSGDSSTSRVTYTTYACVWSYVPETDETKWPDSRSICDIASGAFPKAEIFADDSAGSDDVEKLEGTGASPTPFTFRVQLSHAVPRDTSIRYVLGSGTASGASIYPCQAPDCDFVGPNGYSGYVTVPMGMTTALIDISVIADPYVEADPEQFSVQISDGWPANQRLDMSGHTKSFGRILNDDEYSVGVSDASSREGTTQPGSPLLCDKSPTPLVFTVSLNQVRTETVTVPWATKDGTTTPATAGNDYVAASGVLVFNPGDLSKEITVYPLCDLNYEWDETVEVVLSPPTNAIVRPGGGIGTIENDDDSETIRITKEANFTEGDTGQQGYTFSISLTTNTADPVTVYYQTFDGTAQQPADYTAVTNGSVTLGGNTTSKSVTVYANGDTQFEQDETFFVRLTGFDTANPNAFAIDQEWSQGVATIINDDGGKLNIGDVTLPEGTGCETTPFAFPVTLTKKSDSPVTVNWETASGGAKATSDYTGESGVLTFAPGEDSKSIAVQVTCDAEVEPDEHFVVTLSAPTEAALGQKTYGVGWIANDDVPPTPTVTPVVSGVLGDNDWYVSDVGVHFTVETFGAPLTSSSGCDDVSILTDTAGDTFTCNIETAGGTASASATVKRDATAPTATGGLSGTNGTNGWYVGPVDVTWLVDDNLSGVASGCAPENSAVQGVDLSFACTVTDNAGNEASFTSPLYKLDSTPPTAEGALSGTHGDNGWYIGEVTVHWTVDDNLSGIATGCADTASAMEGTGLSFACTVTDNAGNEASVTSPLYKLDATPPTATGALSGAMGDNGWYVGPVTVEWTLDDNLSGAVPGCPAETSSAEGVGLSFACTASDNAGNDASATSPEYKLDATPPTVTFTGDAGPYNLLDTVAITCTATDALSQVASDTCTGFNGPAYAFLGGRTYTATATDYAGNVGSASVRFAVDATTDDLCKLVKRWVASKGIQNSLCVKLAASDRAFRRGDLTAGNNNLDSFIEEVKAQYAKEIAPANAVTLTEIAGAMKRTAPRPLME